MSAKRIATQDIHLLVFDFDGVLTDNRVLVMEDGREAVFCSRADGLGFDIMRRAGLAVLILSTEKNPVVAKRAAKLRVPVLYGIEEKAAALKKYCEERDLQLDRVVYVGNDLNDLAAIRTAGYSICPKDAHPSVAAECDLRLRTPGGHGVVREIVEKFLRLDYKPA